MRREPGLKARLRAGETVVGTFLNLGSPLAVEVCGLAGFDWLLIDMEHGGGGEATLIAHLLAAENTGAHPVVRVEGPARQRIGRVLDMDAEGIMVPRVESAAEAKEIAAHLHFPPLGDRGVAAGNRFGAFATRADYVDSAPERVTGIVQIETPAGVADAGEIAAVPGIDVLFIGPRDLSLSLGIMGQTSHPEFRRAVVEVRRACDAAGKATGILLPGPAAVPQALEDGFRFIGVGSDSGFILEGAKAAVESVRSGLRQAAGVET